MTLCLIVSFLLIAIGLFGTISLEGMHAAMALILFAAGFVMLTILLCMEKLFKELTKLGQIFQGRQKMAMHQAVAQQEEEFRNELQN